MENSNQKRVLFVCIHNSARSQMAEKFLNELGNGSYKAESAGIEPGKLNPYVIAVMKEAGYDISHHATKSVFDFYDKGSLYDYLVTVCDTEAAEKCPLFPGKVTRLHWGFPDPSSAQGSEEEKLQFARTVRDSIKAKIEEFIEDDSKS